MKKTTNFILELKTMNQMILRNESDMMKQVVEDIKEHLKSLENDPIKYRNHFELISRVFGPDDMFDIFHEEVEKLYVPEYDDQDGVYGEPQPMYFLPYANYIKYDGIDPELIKDDYEAKDPNKYKPEYR